MKNLILPALLALLIFSTPSIAAAQVNAPNAAQPAGPAPETVQLSLKGDIPVSELIDYVAQRLQIRLLYDQEIGTRRVNLIAPDPIPVDSLMEVLQQVLLTEGLVITDAADGAWKRITTNAQIPEVARPSRTPQDLQSAGAAVPLTRIFTLKNAEPAKAIELVQPFLSQQGASIVALGNQGLVIITDVAENVRRAAELIEILEGGRPLVDVRFVPVESVRAEEMAEQLTEILAARTRALGRGEAEPTGLEVTVDRRSNQLILVGTVAELERAAELLKLLDRTLPTVERAFPLEFVSPQRLDEILRGMLNERSVQPPYRSRVEANTLMVESTEEVLSLVDRIRRQLDTREAPASQSPIRFYKIKNVPAQELIETIRGISGGAGPIPERPTLGDRRRTTNDLAVPGPNVPALTFPGAAQPVRELPVPPAVRDNEMAPQLIPIPAPGTVPSSGPLEPGREGLGEATGDLSAANLLRTAEVTVDVHTNTIIVVASPEVQRIYATLIQTLDERRPQVLVEAKVVIIDTSDDYTLGVEVSGGDRTGAKRLFAFSSYGLSDVDPVSGALQIIPGVGFNGTLVDPSTADMVVRALANHRRARVLSTPRILVNDNAEGQLTSVAEVPFTSVNASQTVATTSFAGFAEAGTTITVTPTISDENYLQLDYIVTLNSFTGPGSAGVPPPRQTNEVRSRVTVPDGYTVIVGGLTSSNSSYEISTIPFLEKIPIIRELASLQINSWNETSLFVFLRPVILREDKFKDLKYLTDRDLHRAALPGPFPATQPLLME